MAIRLANGAKEGGLMVNTIDAAGAVHDGRTEGFALETLLHIATKERNAAEVRRMCMQGADVNKSDVDLYTPLHRAADNKDGACVEVLLECKADPNVSHPGLDGWTPLHVAAWRDCPKCTQLLVEAGSDKEGMDWYGQTPFDWAGSAAQEVLATAQPKKKEDAKAEKEDLWATAGLRAPCVMQPSAIHLANIERCLRASDEHGVTQGKICEHFDKELDKEVSLGA